MTRSRKPVNRASWEGIKSEIGARNIESCANEDKSPVSGGTAGEKLDKSPVVGGTSGDKFSRSSWNRSKAMEVTFFFLL